MVSEEEVLNAVISRCEFGKTSSADADFLEFRMSDKQRIVHSALIDRVRRGLTTSYDAKTLRRIFS